MKKLNYFFSLLLLLGFGGSSVQAQDGDNVYFEGELKSTITPGEQVFLKSKHSGKYLDVSLTGNNNGSSTLSDNCIFTFVDAGQVDGQPSYYLQSKATGQYLKASLTPNDETGDYAFPNEWGNGPISYTSSENEAYHFFAGLAVTEKGNMFYSSQLTDVTAEDCLFVFPNVEKRTEGVDEYPYQYLSGYNAYFMLCMYIDTNAWQVYGVVLASGFDKLQALINDLFPQRVEGTFVEGDNPGNVPSAAYQQVVTAYNAANQLITSGMATEEEYSEAADALQAAYDAAVAAICPVKANTYYYITKNQNYAQATLSVNSAGTGWTWANTNIPTDNINYICYVEPGTTDSTFHVYNPATGTYLATLGTNSTQISAVDKSEAGEYLIKNCKNVYFYMTNAGKTQGVHAQADGQAVSWDYTANASHWQFVPVADEIIAELEDQIKKQQLNTRMNNLFTSAFNAYTNSRVYDSEASKDNEYESHGLLNAVDQIWTSPLADGDGSGIPALLDGKIFDNYLHTTYSASNAPNNYHFIGVKLSEKANAVTLKYSRRMSSSSDSWKTQNPFYPTKIAVYATNDTTAATGAWTYIGTVSPKFVTADSTMMASVDLYDNYQYLRFDVVATGGSGGTIANSAEGSKAFPYFYVSELGVYKGTYNQEASLYEQVPEEDANALHTALVNAASQIGADAVTEEGIEQLQTAYDKFMETCPDPQIAKDALASAQTLADSALVGDQPGYVSQETLDALNAAITTESAKISDVMSKADVDAVKANLEAASNTFVSNVIMPSEGTYYYMISGSTANTNAGIKSGSNAEGATLGLGNKTGLGTFDTETAKKYYEYIWMLSKNEDGTYYVRNLGTGFYLKKNTTVQEAYPITLVYSKGGMFHLIVNNDPEAGDSKYLNNNASSVNVWTLDSNCDYGFQTADPKAVDEICTYRAVTKGYTFMCLPYATTGPSNGVIYNIVGINNNQLILAKNADYYVDAGVPFVYYLGDGSVTEDDFGVDLEANLVTTGQTVNGIVGVIGGTKVGPGFGVISNATDGTAKVIATTAEETNVAANTGYLTPEVGATTETGDVQLAMDGEFTGINGVVVIPADGKYYDLQGRRVVKPTKGVYIVNGKKVYVK